MAKLAYTATVQRKTSLVSHDPEINVSTHFLLKAAHPCIVAFKMTYMYMYLREVPGMHNEANVSNDNKML